MPEGKSGSTSLSKEERAAVRDRARELKQQRTLADGVAAVDAAIKALPADERAVVSKIREIVMDAAPDLNPKTYYGMPGWARDDRILCFVQPASKFGTRYSTFGFEQPAKLDDGNLWATAFAVLAVGPEEEKRIRELVKKATSA
jgi:uncharacterized protein YdhG (YjbR/CyaY superfamily)